MIFYFLYTHTQKHSYVDNFVLLAMMEWLQLHHPIVPENGSPNRENGQSGMQLILAVSMSRNNNTNKKGKYFGDPGKHSSIWNEGRAWPNKKGCCFFSVFFLIFLLPLNFAIFRERAATIVMLYKSYAYFNFHIEFALIQRALCKRLLFDTEHIDWQRFTDIRKFEIISWESSAINM